MFLTECIINFSGARIDLSTLSPAGRCALSEMLYLAYPEKKGDGCSGSSYVPLSGASYGRDKDLGEIRVIHGRETRRSRGQGAKVLLEWFPTVSVQRRRFLKTDAARYLQGELGPE